MVQLIGERHGLKESGLTNEAPDKQTDAQSQTDEEPIDTLVPSAPRNVTAVGADFQVNLSLEEPATKVLYDAVIQVLRSNGSLTVVQLDDAIYPITVMKSQRINIIRCLGKLIDQSLVVKTANREGLGDVYYYHLTNSGIVETHEHDDKQPLKPVDEVTGTNKKSDAKAYMLRMLMNHSPEWIREDKLFDTVKENFTGFEDETLKVLIMSLVNYEDSGVGYKNLSAQSNPKQRFYRYQQVELEELTDETEEEPDMSEVYNEEKHMEHVKAMHSRMEIKEIYLCAVYSDMPSSVRIDDGYFDEKEGVKYFIESMHDDGIVCLEPEIILSMMVFNHDTDKSSFLAQRFENLDDLEAWIEPFETALPIETSPQDDASSEASSE